MPERIQRRRTKGWRKPEGAVCVTRPGAYGNPYRAGREPAFRGIWELDPYRLAAAERGAAEARATALEVWRERDEARSRALLAAPEREEDGGQRP